MTDPLVWTATIAFIIALFVFDFAVVIRKPHEPTFRESVGWSVFYIGIALVFGVVMHFWHADFSTTEYLAGYITEKSLSVDNLFVFLVIMTRFAVPPQYRSRVLLVGIAVALVLRAVFIAAGAAALDAFSALFYVFGAFLIYTAWGLAKESNEDTAKQEYEEGRMVRLVRRLYPVTDGYREGRIMVREAGRRMVTPMLLVMVAIGSTDVLFALDSIPAIFGLTQDPFIVFTANAFALLGLRQLYFLVQGLLQRLVYLHYGLAAILAFIGVKLVLHALHENNLPFVNGGEGLSVPEISTALSLTVILAILTIATVASLLATRNRPSDAPEVVREQAGEALEGSPEDVERREPAERDDGR
ncbi:TerC family protein [Demequina activiva]|uniref:Tellurium resistance protein TerC n=1 Tax=Demequina activiva TaxID=1582364 RepID=A0A919Q2N6_9MICO|nr:TerC family protein [Demequina activiva]GIG54494.1 tellurium resistance protein TerC [Demequina activiva]